MADQPIKLAVLISGNGSNLQAIIDQIESGKLNATIECVISNRPNAFGLERASKHGINNYLIDHQQFDTKASFEQEILTTLKPYSVDLIILAGFMRVLSGDFVAQYPEKIVNIHPSLLPKYKGLNTHQRVLNEGDKIHGATVHLVTAELDSGEIIVQQSFAVESTDTLETLQHKTHLIEHKIYPQAIRLLIERLSG